MLVGDRDLVDVFHRNAREIEHLEAWVEFLEDRYHPQAAEFRDDLERIRESHVRDADKIRDLCRGLGDAEPVRRVSSDDGLRPVSRGRLQRLS